MSKYSNNSFLAVDDLFWKNKQLEDLPNEIWADAYGYDGMYSVSNFGRVKSETRRVNTNNGDRLVRARILSQSYTKKRGNIDGLIVSLCKNSKNISKLIYTSFHQDIVFCKNECVIHINKNLTDNRLCNLKKTNRKKSKNIDMNMSDRTIKATPKNLEKANDKNKRFHAARTHKKCPVCGKVDFIDKFPKGRNKCQKCINEYVVKRRGEKKLLLRSNSKDLD